MEAEAARASSHVSVKCWLPEAAKSLVSVCCASDCTLQEALISQIAHKAVKPSDCDSASNGEKCWIFITRSRCGFSVWQLRVFPQRSSGRDFQHCSYPYPGSRCGYRFPSGTKSEESKAANVKALSPLSAANKAQTRLPSSLKWPSQRQ